MRNCQARSLVGATKVIFIVKAREEIVPIKSLAGVDLLGKIAGGRRGLTSFGF